MALQSRLFQADRALEACATQDAAHVVPGAFGDHVSKIHTALFLLDKVSVAPAELRAKSYGPSTAAAVLAYKVRRNIVNTSYQKTADNIVGKMTIASFDREMLGKEREPNFGPSPGSNPTAT